MDIPSLLATAGQRLIDDVQAFGEEADRLEMPCVAEDGFIVPGSEPIQDFTTGREVFTYAERAQGSAAEKAGSTAGSRKGSPAATAAPGAPAYALGSLTAGDIVDQLRDYGGGIAVVRSGDGFCYVKIPVGLFSGLPFSAKLVIEVPLFSRQRLREGMSRFNPVVPDVRAWGYWKIPGRHAELITSHHQYPDQSICACMPNQWELDRDPLIHYVDFCTIWIGKALHEQGFGRYPGLQHCGELIRFNRDRRDEFCGCGRALRYLDCHRDSDEQLGAIERRRRHHAGLQGYRRELGVQLRYGSEPEMAE